MIHRFAGFTPPLARLVELADTSFDASTFKAACEALGPFDVKGSDESLWWFDLAPPDGPRLLACVEDDRVTVAVLPICWWDTPIVGYYDDLADYHADQAEFARAFADALAATVALLGPPLRSATGPDVDYRHALWRRPNGLFVLQQSDSVGQGEDDIHYWISPWAGPDPEPTDPFLDWICRAGPGDDS